MAKNNETGRHRVDNGRLSGCDPRRILRTTIGEPRSSVDGPFFSFFLSFFRIAAKSDSQRLRLGSLFFFRLERSFLVDDLHFPFLFFALFFYSDTFFTRKPPSWFTTAVLSFIVLFFFRSLPIPRFLVLAFHFDSISRSPQIWMGFLNWISIRLIRVSLHRGRVFQSSLIRFYWLFLGFHWIWRGFIGFYWDLLGFTGFYWILLGFTGH